MGRFDVPGIGRAVVSLAAAVAGALSAPVGPADLRGAVRLDPTAGRRPCGRVFRNTGGTVSNGTAGEFPGLPGGGICLGRLFSPAAVGVFVWRGVVRPCRLALRGGVRAAEARATPGVGVDGATFPGDLSAPPACAVRRATGGGKLDEIGKEPSQTGWFF